MDAQETGLGLLQRRGIENAVRGVDLQIEGQTGPPAVAQQVRRRFRIHEARGQPALPDKVINGGAVEYDGRAVHGQVRQTDADVVRLPPRGQGEHAATGDKLPDRVQVLHGEFPAAGEQRAVQIGQDHCAAVFHLPYLRCAPAAVYPCCETEYVYPYFSRCRA